MRLHSTLTKSQRAERVSIYRALRRDNPETPAVALWQDAMRSMFFRAELSASVKHTRKRSAAAKRGWKTRRAA